MGRPECWDKCSHSGDEVWVPLNVRETNYLSYKLHFSEPPTSSCSFFHTHSKSTMWLQTTLVVAICLATARAALTDAELSAFQSGGGCGGSVSITEDGDNYVIVSNGLPDHLWQCVSGFMCEWLGGQRLKY